jgi:glycosyltransferase involved in cell wall biosynthesis
VRITFVLHGFFRRPLGGPRAIYGTASALAARGHRVAVVHPLAPPAEPWALPPKERVKKVVARAWAGLGGAARQARPLWCRLDERVQSLLVPSLQERFFPKADALVATSWNTAEAVARAHASRGRKFYWVFEIETARGPEAEVLASYRLPLAKIVANRSAERALAAMGAPAAGRVPVPFEADRFAVRAPIEGRTGVGMMYSEAPIKGSADGLEAMRRAGVAEPRLFGFGTPPPGVRFVEGPADEALADFYNGLALFVQPSLVEGWGLPAFEAMGCGCAVAATATDGVAEFAEHERTALLSPPGDPGALAANLRRLLADDPLRVRLARAASERVRQFTVEASVAETERLLA